VTTTPDAKPATRTEAITDWLTQHDGWHTPSAVARGVGLPTQQVASTLLYLHRHGRVDRTRGTVSNGPGSSRYAALSDPPSTVRD
jgi:DNA-binding IclR family transcriptional regulator